MFCIERGPITLQTRQRQYQQQHHHHHVGRYSMIPSTWTVLLLTNVACLCSIATSSAFSIVNPTNGGHSRIRVQRNDQIISSKLLQYQATNATEASTYSVNGDATTRSDYENDDNSENGVPLSMDNIERTWNELHQQQHQAASPDSDIDGGAKIYSPLVKDGILPTADPAQIEFVTPDTVLSLANHLDGIDAKASEKEMIDAWMSNVNPQSHNGHYPFAAMMQGSGPYIANHAGKIAVFHIPGDILDAASTVSSSSEKKYCDALLQDIALCWLLDMKIIIVVAVQYSAAVQNSNHPQHDDDDDDSLGDKSTTSSTSGSNNKMLLAHECHNALKVTSQTTLRYVEEEAGFLRTELERKLNRCLRAHHGLGDHHTNRAPEGNVVSGNFYTAHRFGTVRGIEYEYTGYASETHTKNIRQVLDKNDIVLLSTVGLSTMGELVNVNGYHLAATVAASLQASKVIYIASQGSVLRSKKDQTPIQELPVSFAESITAYHQVACSNMGFATFQNAKERLQDSSAVELLLHMAWSCWSVKNGTSRAHICNPSDGSVLEELFTAKNGANTCIYHDDEISSLLVKDAANRMDDHTTQKDWDDFFASASAQGQTVEYFM
jgi:acetylglutamate kinase